MRVVARGILMGVHGIAMALPWYDNVSPWHCHWRPWHCSLPWHVYGTFEVCHGTWSGAFIFHNGAMACHGKAAARLTAMTQPSNRSQALGVVRQWIPNIGRNVGGLAQHKARFQIGYPAAPRSSITCFFYIKLLLLYLLRFVPFSLFLFHFFSPLFFSWSGLFRCVLVPYTVGGPL